MDEKKPELEGNKIEVTMGDTPSADEPAQEPQNVDAEPSTETVATDTEAPTEEAAAEVESEAPAEEPAKDEAKTEVEPSTEAIQAVEQQEVPEESAAAAFPQPAKKDHKKLVMSIVIVGFLLAAAGCVGAWLLLKEESAKTAKTEDTSKTTVQKMGGEVSLIDGTAQVSTDNETWQALAVSDQVKEGSYYKTAADSRLVINLDDGSAVRLNSNSVVKLDSLAANSMVVTNESGEMYSRLVKSDRSFAVKVGDTQYVALGTAYVTLNTTDTKGVEVYESKVGAEIPGEENVEVAEGKYYYEEAVDAKKEKKLGTISVDSLKKDEFVKWNYEQDKKNSEFKDDLGYLENIDKKTEEKEDEPDEDDSPTASLSLSGAKYDTGVKLSWSLANLSASKGFKVLKSKEANPTFGASNTEAVYVSDSNARSYAWSIKDGKAYHFRVCIYNGSGCSKYSNDVTVTAPYKESSSDDVSGSLSLSKVSGNKVEWELNGIAPNGYKLVWSTSPEPSYSDNNDKKKYYSAGSTTGKIDESDGTYYVKVCMYTGSGCTNYSNQITLNL